MKEIRHLIKLLQINFRRNKQIKIALEDLKQQRENYNEDIYYQMRESVFTIMALKETIDKEFICTDADYFNKKLNDIQNSILKTYKQVIDNNENSIKINNK